MDFLVLKIFLMFFLFPMKTLSVCGGGGGEILFGSERVGGREAASAGTPFRGGLHTELQAELMKMD